MIFSFVVQKKLKFYKIYRIILKEIFLFFFQISGWLKFRDDRVNGWVRGGEGGICAWPLTNIPSWITWGQDQWWLSILVATAAALWIAAFIIIGKIVFSKINVIAKEPEVAKDSSLHVFPLPFSPQLAIYLFCFLLRSPFGSDTQTKNNLSFNVQHSGQSWQSKLPDN